MSNKNAKAISRFYIKDIKDNTTVVLVGTRGTGKSTIIKTYLYYNYKKIRLPLLISLTSSTEGEYSGIIPELYTYDEYIPNVIKTYIGEQMLLTKKINNEEISNNIKKLGVMIMDDFVGTSPIYKKDTNLAKIQFAARHFNITSILSVQTAKDFPPGYRDNIDYVIVTSITTEKRKKFFYENFWDGKFGTYDDFIELYNKITSVKHNFMVLNFNGTKTGTDDSINNYVFWGRCPNPIKLKKKRVGIKRIWDLNEKYYNPDFMTPKIELKKNKSKFILK